MAQSKSLRYAKEMLDSKSVVFFEVWVDEDEDLFETAAYISELGCSTVIEPCRRVIKVMANTTMPRGFGFI